MRALLIACAALCALPLAVARAAGGDAKGSGASNRADDDMEAVYQTTVRARRQRAPRQPSDDPSGMTSVVDVQSRRGAGSDLRDVLAEVPGVRVSDSGPSGYQGISMRGSAGHQVVVELDGIRLTPPGGGAVDLSLLDVAQLASIEVRRSGGSARFGSGALGGALVLRTPRLRSRRQTSASLGYGSFNSMRVRASHGQALTRKTRMLFAASYRQTDGDFPYVDEIGRARIRPNNDARVVEALLKVDRLVGRSWRASVLGRFAGAERGAPGLAQRESATARQTDLRGLIGLSLTRWDLLLPRSALTLTLSQRYGYFRYDESSPPPVQSRNHRSGSTLGARWVLPLGRSGRLEAGFEGSAELLRDASGELSQDRLGLSAWVASQARLLSGHLVLAPAVRVVAVQGFDAIVAPKGGMIVRPFASASAAALRGLELVGNIGRRYRVPSLSEMFVRLDGFGSNPNLQPEDALAGDVGLRWTWRRFAAEAGYFRRHIKRAILFAPTSPTLVRAENYSGIDAQGIEAALSLEPGLCLGLRGAYTLTSTRFAGTLRMPGQPLHRVVGRVSWSGRRCSARWRRSGAAGRWLGGLELHAGVIGESEMALDRFNNVREEGRVLLSVGGSYRPPRWSFLALSAEGRNLLDKRDAVDTVGFPLAPARFFVSLSARF
ncbi:MAG: TonB-dependent receptor [Myxococcales bacterium]|nr:TonB-dependent receptor [Myxococcales bacterium]